MADFGELFFEAFGGYRDDGAEFLGEEVDASSSSIQRSKGSSGSWKADLVEVVLRWRYWFQKGTDPAPCRRHRGRLDFRAGACRVFPGARRMAAKVAGRYCWIHSKGVER